MVFKDYYKILGLESNKVTSDEIKIAYREMAKKYHPDINVGDSHAEEIFKDVNEAYKTLSNPKLRRKYDFNWNRYFGKNARTSEKKQKKSLKEILIDILFGGSIAKTSEKKVAKPEYGENINTKINVSLQDAFYGCYKKIKLLDVNGRPREFSFKIPSGIQNYDKIRIPSQGKHGKNGGKNGDLLVEINILNDKYIKLYGTDLIMEIPIKPYEAALGATKIVNVLDEQIRIIIPKNSSSGDRIIINNKGYKTGMGQRGNLQIISKIVMPKELTEQEKELYIKLKELDANKVIYK